MTAITALLAWLAFWAGPNDPAQPTVNQVIDSLERTESAIKNLSVTTEYVKKQKDFLPRLVELHLTSAFIVDHDGRTRYECVGEQVNHGQDGVTTYRGRWRSAYDGKVATTLTGGVDGPFHMAELDRWPAWHGVNPLEFTTHYFKSSRS